MENLDNVRAMLSRINADDYDTYLKVVAGLRYSAMSGDMRLDEAYELARDWAATSDKFDPVEFDTKWKSLNGQNGGAPCTMATITHLAKMSGMTFGGSNETFRHNDVVTVPPELYSGIDYTNGGDMPVSEQKRQILAMLALYDDTDKINIVTSYINRNGKYFPSGNGKTRTVAEWKDYINTNIAAGRPPLNNDIDPDDPEHAGEPYNMGGVWIRINPLDGNGIKNNNVAAFKYALIESDVMDKKTQLDTIKKLGLPAVICNDSGGKSIHAIINVGAENYAEYAETVNWLYDYCDAHGLKVDRADRNPSRLTRLPGCKRGDKWQCIVDTGEDVYTVGDFKADLEVGEPYDSGDDWDSYDPDKERDPELIEGLLIQGGVMGIISSSKAGKTTLLTSLATSVATGTKWMGRFQAKCGKVVYCNMELTNKYFKKKIHEVGDALGLKPSITVFDLADKDIDLKRLTSRLERVCGKGGYKAIIIDPIYTLLDGDENKAQDVARFMKGLHMLAARTNTSVIFAHHYSKGPAWVKAEMDPMDRASGSGVFARSVDTLVTLTRRAYVPPIDHPYRTAWKVETVLRQYGKSPEFDVFFDYPLHHIDTEGVLKDLPFYGDKSIKGGIASGETRAAKAEGKKDELEKRLVSALCTKTGRCDTTANGAPVLILTKLLNSMDIGNTTFKRYVKEINDDMELEGVKFRTKKAKNLPGYKADTVVIYCEKDGAPIPE